VKIKVTQEHIDKGIRCSPYSCPIALAVEDYDSSIKFSVGVSKINIYGDVSEPCKQYRLPEEAREFVDKFDHDFIVEPFEFELQ
jgi:hypothetical protein